MSNALCIKQIEASPSDNQSKSQGKWEMLLKLLAQTQGLTQPGGLTCSPINSWLYLRIDVSYPPKNDGISLEMNKGRILLLPEPLEVKRNWQGALTSGKCVLLNSCFQFCPSWRVLQHCTLCFTRPWEKKPQKAHSVRLKPMTSCCVVQTLA